MTISECDILRSNLNAAIRLLAEWCVAIDENGIKFVEWSDYYYDALEREGPLRLLLDEAIAKVRYENSL